MQFKILKLEFRTWMLSEFRNKYSELYTIIPKLAVTTHLVFLLLLFFNVKLGAAKHIKLSMDVYQEVLSRTLQ